MMTEPTITIAEVVEMARQYAKECRKNKLPQAWSALLHFALMIEGKK